MDFHQYRLLRCPQVVANFPLGMTDHGGSAALGCASIDSANTKCLSARANAAGVRLALLNILTVIASAASSASTTRVYP